MAAGGSSEELARPETTGYGHTDSGLVDDTGVSQPRDDLRHVNEERYEPRNWAEAWDERHRQPRRRRAPAGQPAKLKPEPEWPVRTEASMSGWKTSFFGQQVSADDLKPDAGGVIRHNGRPLAVQYQNMFVVVEHPAPAYVSAVQDLIAGAKKRGLKVERLDDQKLDRFVTTVGRIGPKDDEGDAPMSGIAKSRGTRKAKSDGVAAGHKKIINELLEKEDAKPTGDAVRLAESNPRKDFARYQIPTDRGLKDIEIWPDGVKVRSEASYGFPKKAQDDIDGLPDRVAPPVPDMGGEGDTLPDGTPDEAPEEMPEEGLPLCVTVSVTSPEGMEEEEIISVLDEVLRDSDIADAINERLTETGLSLSVLEIDTPDEDDEDEEYIDDIDDIDDGEVVDPIGDEESCSRM